MKKIWILVAICMSCLSTVIFFSDRIHPQPLTLELGMFTGGNWDTESDTYNRIIDRAISIFESGHPGVRVHYYSGIRKDNYGEWCSEQIMQGKMPDVAITLSDQFDKFVSMGILMDLDPLIKQQSELKKSDYFNNAIQAGTIGGKLYGIPYEEDFKLMAVNKTLLEKKGCHMPGKYWTWNEFYDLCKMVSYNSSGVRDPETAGVCNYTWEDAVVANGIRLFDRSGRHAYFSNAHVFEAVRFMQRLSSLNTRRVFTEADFQNGNVAFMPMSFSTYRTYVSFPHRMNKSGDEWRYTTMPSGYAGGNFSQMEILFMGISAHTRYPKLAFELLKTFTHNEEIQKDLYRYAQGASPLICVTYADDIPSFLEMNMTETEDLYHNMPMLIDIIRNGIPSYKFPQYDENMSIADNVIEKLIDSKKNTYRVLKQLQRTIQTDLER